MAAGAGALTLGRARTRHAEMVQGQDEGKGEQPRAVRQGPWRAAANPTPKPSGDRSRTPGGCRAGRTPHIVVERSRFAPARLPRRGGLSGPPCPKRRPGCNWKCDGTRDGLGCLQAQAATRDVIVLWAASEAGRFAPASKDPLQTLAGDRCGWAKGSGVEDPACTRSAWVSVKRWRAHAARAHR